MATLVLLVSACAVNQDAVEMPASESATVLVPGEAGNPTLELLVEIEQPVDAASRVGDESIYLVSRTGLVHRVSLSNSVSAVVLDISDLTEAEGERGLLGLAFSPDGKTAYLNFTDLAGDTQIVVLDVDGAGKLARSTMETLLTVKQPYSNHNGGDLVVEPSGSLLVATGDGGSGGDPDRLALDDSSLLGKVLRIDPATREAEIIARGLRNPWRIDLYDDRLWLADVGQGTWEEVSVLENVSRVTSPVDFGWSAYEGFVIFSEDQSSPEHVPPVMVYEHGDDGCSISGGAIATAGSLVGRYVFADYCSGKVWSISATATNPTKELIVDGIDSPVAVVRVGDELLVLSLDGVVWRIVQ